MPKKTATPAASPDSSLTDVSGLSFEQAIGELEQIVDNMESGDISLQESLAAYQRGAALVGHCRHSLSAVAEQVKVLEEGLLKPLEGGTRTDDGNNS